MLEVNARTRLGWLGWLTTAKCHVASDLLGKTCHFAYSKKQLRGRTPKPQSADTRLFFSIGKMTCWIRLAWQDMSFCLFKKTVAWSDPPGADTQLFFSVGKMSCCIRFAWQDMPFCLFKKTVACSDTQTPKCRHSTVFFNRQNVMLHQICLAGHVILPIQKNSCVLGHPNPKVQTLNCFFQ